MIQASSKIQLTMRVTQVRCLDSVPDGQPSGEALTNDQEPPHSPVVHAPLLAGVPCHHLVSLVLRCGFPDTRLSDCLIHSPCYRPLTHQAGFLYQGTFHYGDQNCVSAPSHTLRL